MTRKRRDANHAEIVNAYERMNCSVRVVADLPGALDLIVGYRGVDARVEIKDGAKPPSARKLTAAEAEELARWRGRPPEIVCTVDDVHEHVTAMAWESLQLANARRAT